MASTMHGGMIDAWSTMLPPLADPAVGRWFAATVGDPPVSWAPERSG